MSPRVDTVRNGEITWSGVEDVIALRILENNTNVIEPKFTFIQKEIDKLKSTDRVFREFVARQDKRDKERMWLNRAIGVMMLGVFGDAVWYWLKVWFATMHK